VRARKRLSEDALAGVAGGAKEKDFHNRISSLITLSRPHLEFDHMDCEALGFRVAVVCSSSDC
jgi:hypothetical protein